MKEDFVEACEALAELLESNGRTDLAAIADRASYWLAGGDGLDVMSISEVVSSCRETLNEALVSDGLDQFINRTEQEVLMNLDAIKAAVKHAADRRAPDELIDLASRVQAAAILTSAICQRRSP